MMRAPTIEERVLGRLDERAYRPKVFHKPSLKRLKRRARPGPYKRTFRLLLKEPKRLFNYTTFDGKKSWNPFNKKVRGSRWRTNK